MKTFNQFINESVIVIPNFYHADLSSDKDPDSKFWAAVANANDETEGVDKQRLENIAKKAKDLYSMVAALGEEYTKLAQPIHDIVKKINSDAKSMVQTGASPSEIKQLQSYILCLHAIDADFSTKKWYSSASLAIKYGYVPFRGSTKDPKIKYRLIVRVEEPLTDSAVQVIKRIKNLNPCTQDYIAGIEFNKDHTAFQVLFASNPGYKR